ncbi:nucleoside/nucleotide kinase family protein [Stackebrandtia soli]|uniref:nucleoside/nucleotide kinase family protein n=1 Tax=Stackebrandtia soli TaxID=1892856 RepID=UPI0039EA3184
MPSSDGAPIEAGAAFPDALLVPLLDRVDSLLKTRRRVLLGVVGEPGVGKSTLAEALLDGSRARGVPTERVAMDGFHLADRQLDRLNRRDRKGAIDTFDAHGYLALLRRVATELDHTVYAPAFDRTREEPVAGAVAVPPGTRLVVTEGNYLLDDAAPWHEVRAALTETWFCETDSALRRRRLIDRHVHFGKSPDAARHWVDTVDEINAARVVAHRDRADLIVRF